MSQERHIEAINRQKDAYALKCIKESILSLISDAKTAKEAWDTLERCFGEVKDEGGSVAADPKRDEEFVESHCAQSRVDEICEEITEVAEREHEDVCEPHCTQLQVDEDLLIPATWIADEDLVIPATELVDDEMVNPAMQLVDENLMVDVNFDNEFLTNDYWLQMMQQKYDIDMMLFGEITPLQLVEDNPFAALQVSGKETETEAKKEVCKVKAEIEKEEETESKNEVCKRKAEKKTDKEADKEAQQEKALIAE